MNIVITGGTKGIGQAIAETFAAGGHNIAVCARRVHDLNAMQSAFIASYPSVAFHAKVADVSKLDDVKAFAAWLHELDFAPDVLVNNAGHFAAGSIHNEPEDALEQMMKANVYGAYHLTRYLLVPMMARRSGHIFNICSVASFKAFDNVGAYGISKFALLGFSRNLREEMKPHGIKVTAVCPGATYTASWDGADIDPKRLMEDKDVAQMVYAAAHLSPQAVVEEIVMRPMLGDL